MKEKTTNIDQNRTDSLKIKMVPLESDMEKQSYFLAVLALGTRFGGNKDLLSRAE